MLVARRWLLLALAPLLACMVVDEPSKPVTASDTSRPPAPEPAPAQPAPPPVSTGSFDPATATTIEARIVQVPTPESWAAYGTRQSVGAIVVEVLDIGEPPPRMQLFVSCPTDRRGDLFVVGATHVFGLYEREQAWPSMGGVAEDLPGRYVKSVTDSAG